MRSLRRKIEQAARLVDGKRFVEARPLVSELVRKVPEHPLTWNLKGALAYGEEDLETAITAFTKAAALAPGNATLQAHLGEAYRKAGRYAEAVSCLETALRLNPTHAAARINLGAALVGLRRHDEALAHLRKAVRLAPDHPEAHTNLALALARRGEVEEAIPAFERALALSPDHAYVLREYGRCLEQIDRLEDAAALYARIPSRADDVDSEVARLNNLARRGRDDEAWPAVRELAERQPQHVGAAILFAMMAPRHGQAEQARARLMELAGSTLADADRERVCFELGGLCETLGVHDAAFAAYRRANELSRRDYDHAAQTAEQDAIERVYGPGWQEQLGEASNRSEVPVFIVGMPRSGTTLLEQILACHPDVHGAGELLRVPDMTREIAAAAGGEFPGCMRQADGGLLDRFAKSHLAYLAKISGSALRVIDKLPHNYVYLGLIEQLFPRARVIHSARDRLDTCLSCYFQDFEGGHGYCYDLEKLGAHYRLYERAMAHWREVGRLPILEVSYEALVEDLEGVSRKMIAFLGLAWDARCLRFYETRRHVLTASREQVRRPIYTSSIGRHRHYAAHLGPLIAALEAHGG